MISNSTLSYVISNRSGDQNTTNGDSLYSSDFDQERHSLNVLSYGGIYNILTRYTMVLGIGSKLAIVQVPSTCM